MKIGDYVKFETDHCVDYGVVRTNIYEGKIASRKRFNYELSMWEDSNMFLIRWHDETEGETWEHEIQHAIKVISSDEYFRGLLTS